MDEYIKRSEIRKMAMFEMAYTMETETDAAVVLCMIDSAPSADVAPVVHARWDDSGRYTFPGGSTAVSCTECGCKLTVSEFRLNKWNYCPNCGAKMDGSEIDETN